jgi:hypothetical protein
MNSSRVETSGPPSLFRLFVSFLRLGTTAYVGPIFADHASRGARAAGIGTVPVNGYYQSHCVAEYGADGPIVNVLVVSRDLTERKRAEEALRQARDGLELRVAERTAELQRANERLREENQDRLRAEKSLRVEEARLDALLHLSRISDAPLDEITGFALEKAIALTRSKIGFLGFLNEDETVYHLHSVSKDVVKECNVAGNPMQWQVAGAGIWADAVRERRSRKRGQSPFARTARDQPLVGARLRTNGDCPLFRAGADHRHDGPRDERGPGALSGGRDGRLPFQAGQRTRDDRPGREPGWRRSARAANGRRSAQPGRNTAASNGPRLQS